MLGWQFFIERLISQTGKMDHKRTETRRLAAWVTGLNGIDWIEEMAEEGKAVLIETNGGFPVKYISSFANIMSRINSGPPAYKGGWVVGDDYATPPGWNGQPDYLHDEIALCKPGDIIIIEAWDQS